MSPAPGGFWVPPRSPSICQRVQGEGDAPRDKWQGVPMAPAPSQGSLAGDRPGDFPQRGSCQPPQTSQEQRGRPRVTTQIRSQAELLAFHQTQRPWSCLSVLLPHCFIPHRGWVPSSVAPKPNGPLVLPPMGSPHILGGLQLRLWDTGGGASP